mmetsp:Transcript_36578/g.109233  ORF Transcript_36578/g.109233 Transcript_36578/m.109233 type:complete len:240 (+) Transcript_36578:111-830(+)
MADALAHEIRLMLLSDIWAVVNSAKAWTLVKNKNHKELAHKALEDSQHAGMHARKVEEMGVMSVDAIRMLRTFASAAGNEAARFVLHSGEFEQKFDENSMLTIESAGVRADTLFLNKAWETMMQAIKNGAAYIYFTEMRKKDKAANHKAEFDRLLKNWASLAKVNIRDREAFNAKQAKEAAEKAMQEAKDNEKAQAKAEKKAQEMRRKYHRELQKKAADQKQDFLQMQQRKPPLPALKG